MSYYKTRCRNWRGLRTKLWGWSCRGTTLLLLRLCSWNRDCYQLDTKQDSRGSWALQQKRLTYSRLDPQKCSTQIQIKIILGTEIWRAQKKPISSAGRYDPACKKVQNHSISQVFVLNSKPLSFPQKCSPNQSNKKFFNQTRNCAMGYHCPWLFKQNARRI